MKNFVNKSAYFLSLCMLVFLSSCSKDDDSGDNGDKSGFDGSKQSIEEFVGPDIYDQLVDFGFNIHEGSEPPSISGNFYADNLEILNSSVPGDMPGTYIVEQTH